MRLRCHGLIPPIPFCAVLEVLTITLNVHYSLIPRSNHTQKSDTVVWGGLKQPAYVLDFQSIEAQGWCRQMIHVGTCSWTDPTLINTTDFYPKVKMSAEERLRFYAARFDTVEVDSTFYALPAERMVQLQVERTPADFTLHYKAYGLMTQHPIDPARLPRAVKDILGPQIMGRRRLSYKEMPQDARALAFRMFHSALRPAHEAGKLGVVLFQFPPFFTFGTKNFDYILAVSEEMVPYRLAVEFRHGSWTKEDNLEQTLEFLRTNDLVYVSVDEPQFETGSTVPPLARATSDLAYVRFHGRNRESWYKKGITAAERFAYSYTDDELTDWIPKLRRLEAETQGTYAMLNNCYQDFAVKNGAHLIEMLTR